MSATAKTTENWDHLWSQFHVGVALSPAHALRRKWILEQLDRGDANDSLRVIDAGCGPGDLLVEVRREFPKAAIAGLELSPLAAGIARRKNPGATVLVANLDQVWTPPAQLRKWATYAVCSETLENCADPDAVVRNLSATLKPGGRLLITVPGGPMTAYDRYLGQMRHYTVASLRELLTANGFEVERVNGIGFPFFNLYRLVVLMRGRKMIGDASSFQSSHPSRLARLASFFFRHAFKMNLASVDHGWQLVAVARKARK